MVKATEDCGSIAHLTLQAMEGYSDLYKRLTDLVITGIGQPNTVNPEWTGEGDTVHHQYIYSEWQNQNYDYFQTIQRELQVDVAEPMANVARIAAVSFTNALDKRREKVITRIKKNNSNAAAAITRIPPLAHYMFGGDHSQLAKVVELTKDLSSTANKQSYINTPSKSKYKGGSGGGGSQGRGGHGGGSHGRGGGGHGASGSDDQKSGAGKGGDSFRGGNSSRGRKN